MIFDVVTNKLFKALLDGTAKVGMAKDAEKLGGNGASEYALGKDYLPLVPKKQTGNSSDELVAIYENLHNEASDRSEYTATIFHNIGHPELGGGTWLLHGYRQAKLFGMQIAYGFIKTAVRFLQNGTWGAWTVIATIADLANYLPKTGGRLTGDVEVNNGYGQFVAGVKSAQIHQYDTPDDTNNRRFISIYGKDMPIAEALGLIDYTDGKQTKCNILHSGNIGSYALPIGGGVIKGTSTQPLSIRSNDATIAFLKFLNNVELYLGSIGFDGANNPVFLKNDGATKKQLHHDGNSAKVVFTEDSTTAPDSTALWAHL